MPELYLVATHIAQQSQDGRCEQRADEKPSISRGPRRESIAAVATDVVAVPHSDLHLPFASRT